MNSPVKEHTENGWTSLGLWFVLGSSRAHNHLSWMQWHLHTVLHLTRTGSVQGITMGPVDAAEPIPVRATFSKAFNSVLQGSLGNLEQHFVPLGWFV